MPTLIDLMAKIGPDKMGYQLLDDSILEVSQKPRDCEITFVTAKENRPNVLGGDKTAIVVWVDAEEFRKASKALQEESYP